MGFRFRVSGFGFQVSGLSWICSSKSGITKLVIFCCRLPSVSCRLSPAFRPLLTAFCLLPSVSCLLLTAFCLLPPMLPERPDFFDRASPYSRGVPSRAPRLQFGEAKECRPYSHLDLSGERVRIRSTYFAITSASRFTSSPGRKCEKFVTSQVLGITAISN